MSRVRSFRALREERRRILERCRKAPAEIDVLRARDAGEWLLRGGRIVPLRDGEPIGPAVPADALEDELRELLQARAVQRYTPTSVAASSAGDDEREVDVWLRIPGRPPRLVKGRLSRLGPLRGDGPWEPEDAEYRLSASLELRLAQADLPDGVDLPSSQVVLSLPASGSDGKRRWLGMQPWAAVHAEDEDVRLALELREPLEVSDLPAGPLDDGDLQITIQCAGVAGGGDGSVARSRTRSESRADLERDLDWRELEDAAADARADPHGGTAHLADVLFRYRPYLVFVGQKMGVDDDDLVTNVLLGRPRKRDPDRLCRGLIDRIVDRALELRTRAEFLAYLHEAVWFEVSAMHRERSVRAGREVDRDADDLPAGGAPDLTAVIHDEVAALAGVAGRLLEPTDWEIFHDWMAGVPVRDTALRLNVEEHYPSTRLCHHIQRRKLVPAGVSWDVVRALREYCRHGGQPFPRCVEDDEERSA